MDSTTSSIVGSLGGGSGVDMVKLASDLSVARFAAQVQQLKSRSELNETRISSAAALKGQLSQLATALGDRVRDGDLAPSATAANAAVATVSVAPGQKAGGSYSLEVTRLATTQVLASKAYASADAKVGAGTLTIRFGTVAGTGFTADTAKPALPIAVTADDTLATLADKITNSGGGLTAYVATNAAGAQLVIKGPEGAASGFTLEGTGASASGSDVFGRPRAANAGNINFLDWKPGSDSGQLKQTAQDAAFKLDGVEMTSSSNTATNLPGGLTLKLTATNVGTPTQIAFETKDKAVAAVMKDLVAALNDVAAQLKESAAPIGGELGNDSGARRLKRELSSLSGTLVMPNAAPGGARTLGDLGVSLNRDGTFKLDTDRLNATLKADPEGVAAMFTTGLYGVYGTVDKLARSIGLSSDPGSLGGSIQRYQTQQQQITDKLAKISEQQETLRTQLSKTLTWADRSVSSSQSTLSFLKGQIAAWNASDN